MAQEKSAFFNSIEKDRIYQADAFARYFRDVLTDGILNGGYNLQVTADDTGMRVYINFGRGNIQGYSYWCIDNNAGQLTLPIDAAISNPRIDRVVLRLDKTNERTITATVHKGIEAVTPLPPELERTGNIHELSLAQVHVTVGKLVISEEDITDERYDPELCGTINSLITVDTSEMLDRFNAFMETIQAQSPVLHSEIVDNLSTAEVDKVLSANMGKIINDMILSLAPVSNPNLLIDGGLTVSQRGTTFTNPSNAYTLDRFRCSGTGTVTAITNGGMKITGTINVKYIMEDADFAAIHGKTVTLSKSVNGIITSNTFVATSATVIDENITDSTVNWFKLELGKTATPFTPRPYGEELALCKRYYERIITGGISNLYLASATYYTADGGTTGAVRWIFTYVQKRVNPSVSFSGTFAFRPSANATLAIDPVNQTAGSVIGPTVAFFTTNVGSYSQPANTPGVVRLNSVDSYIDIDAEIY